MNKQYNSSMGGNLSDSFSNSDNSDKFIPIPIKMTTSKLQNAFSQQYTLRMKPKKKTYIVARKQDANELKAEM